MKKKLKQIITIIMALVLFLGCGEVFRYLLIDDTKSYTRLMMHQLYHSDENIDVLFVGSSHVYRSLIPEITDKGLGAYTFNVGTSGQQLDGSLVLIKEAIQSNDVSDIYLEVYYDIATKPEYKERTLMTDVYLISDYMRPSFNKLQYLLQASVLTH